VIDGSLRKIPCSSTGNVYMTSCAGVKQ
jgi:hypothetical protein